MEGQISFDQFKAKSVKSILVQVHRRAYRDEEKADAYLVSSNSSLRPQDNLRPDAPSPPETNVWLIISDTVDGPKISEIFRVLPQDRPIHSRTATSCVTVDSHLYDIGGHGSIDGRSRCWSNQIRRLDTLNPQDGWKSQDLPIYCSDPRTAVYGQFIYVFPGTFPFELTYQISDPKPWACVYDVVQNESCALDLPPDCQYTQLCLCVPAPPGVQLPIKNTCGEVKWFMHVPFGWKWEEIDDECSFLLNSKLWRKRYAVSNDTLYILDPSVKPRAGLFLGYSTFHSLII